MTENEISRIIVDSAIEVHRELGGPGLIEDVYEEALEEELRLRGLNVDPSASGPDQIQRSRASQTAEIGYEDRRTCAG